MIAKPEIQEMASQILSKEQLRRLKQIIKEASAIDLARNAVASKEGVISGGIGKIRTILAQVAGARTGTTVAKGTGTGGIQMQAIFSRQAREALEKFIKDPATKLLNDAFMSKDTALLEALLTEIVDEKSLAKVSRQLNAWLAVTLFELGEKTVPEIADDVEGFAIDLSDSLGFDQEGRLTPSQNPVIDIGNNLEVGG